MFLVEVGDAVHVGQERDWVVTLGTMSLEYRLWALSQPLHHFSTKDRNPWARKQ